MQELDTVVDIITEGEYADHDEVKVVMTRDQLAVLGRLLDEGPSDAEDVNDPAVMSFVTTFARQIKDTLK